MALSPQPAEVEQTEVGSYFVANYPPFSVWTPEAVAAEARPALESAPSAGVPLGLYLHIPFCRKRCHFCYFRVYTDRNAKEVESYLDLLAREWELYAPLQAIAGRFQFAAADILAAVQDLAVQIGQVDIVGVDQSEGADAGGSEVKGGGRSEATRADA